MIAFLKETSPGFSYRYFSRVAGFSSPNFLKLVAEGKRNLSLRSVPKFGRGLGLNQREQDIFETLVRLEQSVSDEERNRYYQQLRRRSRLPGLQARMEEAFFQVHATWYALPICALVARPDFREDPGWISRRLNPAVRPGEVKRALALLEEVGMVDRDPQGRLRPSEGAYQPSPKIAALARRNRQRVMLELAGQTLDHAAPGGRSYFSERTLLLTEDQRAQVQALLSDTAARLDGILSQANPDAPTEAYHLGAQLFALSRTADLMAGLGANEPLSGALARLGLGARPAPGPGGRAGCETGPAATGLI